MASPKSDLIHEIYMMDNVLPLIESLIKEREIPQHLINQDLKKFEKLKECTGLKKEIWPGKGRWWDPASGFLAFVDIKGVLKFQIVLAFYDRLKFLYISDIFKTKRIITNKELLEKGKLDPNNFILQDYGLNDYFVFYEDEYEAFEITAKSLFPEEPDYHLKGILNKKFEVLKFMYNYDIHKFRGKIDEYTITGNLNLKDLIIANLNKDVIYHPS